MWFLPGLNSSQTARDLQLIKEDQFIALLCIISSRWAEISSLMYVIGKIQQLMSYHLWKK